MKMRLEMREFCRWVDGRGAWSLLGVFGGAVQLRQRIFSDPVRGSENVIVSGSDVSIFRWSSLCGAVFSSSCMVHRRFLSVFLTA